MHAGSRDGVGVAWIAQLTRRTRTPLYRTRFDLGTVDLKA
jgi:hypothetical protein